MKFPLLIIFTLLFIFSCSKSSNTLQPSSNVKLVDSTLQAANGIKTKFSYDQNNQLASILIHSSQFIGLQPVEDTFLMVFNLTGTTAPPTSYDYTWYIPTNSTDAIEHHVLLYDNQNRIILDSMAYGTTTLSAYVYLENSRYIYNTGNIIIQHYTNNIGAVPAIGPSVISDDTISISNGNVTRNANWLLSTNGPAINQIDNYTYTSYHNPLFQTNLANSLGALLLYNRVGDFISNNFMSPYGAPSNIYAYHYLTDSTGDLTTVNRIDSCCGYSTTLLQFKYK